MPLLVRFFMALCALSIVFAAAARAQESEQAPERTTRAGEALAQAQWEALEDGLSVLRAPADKPAMTVFRISPKRFSFAVALQKVRDGERVETVGPREKAVVAVNGGFFGERQESGELFAVGLLRRKGRQHSLAWSSTGGFLILLPRGPRIKRSSQGVPGGDADVLQSKPLLIEPGGKWAMNSNQLNLRQRTIVCLKPDGEVILFLAIRPILSLYEAGWLMRDTQSGGFFGCDSALALDGGGSTQLWVEGRDDLSFRGETPVHNALVIRRKR